MQSKGVMHISLSFPTLSATHVSLKIGRKVCLNGAFLNDRTLMNEVSRFQQCHQRSSLFPTLQSQHRPSDSLPSGHTF